MTETVLIFSNDISKLRKNETSYESPQLWSETSIDGYNEINVKISYFLDM